MAAHLASTTDSLKSRTRRFFLAIAIMVLAFSVYSNSLSNGFVYDDARVVSQNNFIKNPKMFHELFGRQYFSLSGELSYRPVVTMSYFFDNLLWGQNPRGYHLTNVALHALMAACLFALVALVSGRSIAAALAAAIFAVHPLNSEAANAVGFREDLLAALFFTSSFLLYIKSSSRDPMALFKRISLRGASLLAFSAALFSKETAAVLPALLMAYDLGFKPPAVRASNREGFLSRYCGYAAILAFYLVVRFYLLRDPRELSLVTQYDPFFDRFAAWLSASGYYLAKTLFPAALNADYDFTVKAAASGTGAAASAGLIAALAVGVYIAARSRAALFFSAWAFLALLPASNIVPIANPLAERYLYLPMAGLAAAAAICLGRVREELGGRKFSVGLFWISVTVALGFGAILTYQRNFDWRDELSLWTDTASKSPQKARVRFARGAALAGAGDRDKSLAEYAYSLSLEPAFAKAFSNVGTVYHGLGRLDAAMVNYKSALAFDRENSDAMYNLGKLFKDKALPGHALPWYRMALAGNRLMAEAHYNMGNIYQEASLNDKASLEYSTAAYIDPYHASALNNLGTVLEKQGNLRAALRAYRRSTEAAPSGASSLVNLGNVYARMGENDLAAANYIKAIGLDAGFLAAHNNLGALMVRRKSMDKAAAEYKIALGLDGSNRPVALNLANIYALKGLSARAEAEYNSIAAIPDGEGLQAREKLVVLLAGRQSYDKAAWEFISLAEDLSGAGEKMKFSAGDFLKLLRSKRGAP